MDNEIINCDEQGNIFTGVSECGGYDTGDYFGTLISKKGTSIPNDSTFLTKLLEEVKKNNILPFKGYDYRNAHEDNVINTSSIGNMKLQRLGKPMFEVDLALSICELKSASKINNSSDKWDFMQIYENAIVCAKNSAGAFIGFDCNVIHLESTKLKEGSNLQMKTMKAQLRSSTQYNEGMTLIPITAELAEVKELSGIIGLSVAVVITDSTHLDVTITDGCSHNGVDGFTDNDDVQLTGNTSSTLTSITSNGNGNYTYVISALSDGETVGVKVAESGFQSTSLDGENYGGSSSLKTVGGEVPEITSANTAAGVVGTPFTYQIVATNIPTSYALVDVLPGGLSLNTSTGVISGTPTGSANIKVVGINAINAAGTGSGFLTITITV